MKIYLAGAISHLDPLLVAENFSRAERCVEGCGHEALNPLKLVDQREDRSWEECIVDCVRIILCTPADALYMLPNWQDSRGARAEHALATSLGTKIYYAASGVPENV